MPKYRIYGMVQGIKFLGVYEADTPEQAKTLAEPNAHVSLCHQCAGEMDGAEITDELQAELVED